ncbi:MAG: dihydropteroate synthase [Verrucomicrobiia bacterium Tous-C2TDCM]|nr:MAG: dihydropteroate synthase [Verrucomicrobiae bacterium Tous-C2TDCM]
MKWRCLDRTLDLSRHGEIMGIVNVTPDSFSDGGLFATVDAALEQARRLIAEGAALIDIGGESTRPGAAEVDEAEELQRVLPVISQLAAEHPDTILSIDTCKAGVAAAAVAAGARIINDVRGFRDAEMVRVAAESGAGLVVMHMSGTPRTMQSAPAYADLHGEITGFFRGRLDALIAAGVAAEAIVFDPGIGFGKTLDHNLSILRELDRYTIADRPILLGVSRKSFLAKVTGSDRIEDRAWGTVAITAHARELGTRLHRVHEVKSNLEALRMTEAILDGVLD